MKAKENVRERMLIKRKMEFHPELCTGCLQCLMGCSLEYEQVVNPLLAKSSVIKEGGKVKKITLRNDCTFCGLCTTLCLYGARKLGRSL
jgi:Fe-S-cluster-containing dehydrogenase component